MLKCNEQEHCIDIEDLGVTVRTLLAVGVSGYKACGRRRWDIRFKGAIIGKIQVSTIRQPPYMTSEVSEPVKKVGEETSNKTPKR